MGADRLVASDLERHDSLFIAPHGDDVALGCPARLQYEAERGRRVLVTALFEPVGGETAAARAVRTLGAGYVAAGLPAARDRRAQRAPATRVTERGPEDEDVVFEAARLLAEIGPATQAIHVYAPLGLGSSVDHLLTYEAAVRAFATEAGRNLFLYEERPEAFVPGAVRTRLALLGARLPPGAARTPERVFLLRHLWRVNEPARLRGGDEGIGERLRAIVDARRRFRLARPWNPQRAFGPRLQPIVYTADEDARNHARAAVAALLPRDRKGRPRAARRFDACAAAAAKKLGGVYHAERLWLFLPSGDGVPEVRHPMEMAEGTD
jgi:LmbE family N-acetylglucosaminyl deacetylase